MSVAHKVALVTGAAQGIGRGLSEILLKHGAKVLLTDVNQAAGDKTLAELTAKYDQSRVAFVQCDITKQEQLETAFATAKSQLGGIDIVVNNAGIGDEGDRWENTVDVNLKGTVKATKMAIDNLRKDRGGKGGVIVNMASMAGLNPNPCGPVYCATKAAIIMFSQCWGMNPDVTGNGVRINILAPAFVDTDLVKQQLQKGKDVIRPDIAAMMVERVGIMPVEQVAEALLELVTDESKHNAVLKISASTGKSYQ